MGRLPYPQRLERVSQIGEQYDTDKAGAEGRLSKRLDSNKNCHRVALCWGSVMLLPPGNRPLALE